MNARELTLIIGNKNYSSWSLRPWMLLKALGVPFTELQIPLDTPEFKREIGRWSAAGRVPVLCDGDLRIWDSLAICEYVCEIAGRGWPAERQLRAHARAVAAEMHSGFHALRSQWPMNVRARERRTNMTPALAADIARIDASWADCRERHADRGPWLFGEYSAADAMYAPVVMRFRTYGASLSARAAAYQDHALRDPVLAEWVAAGERETWVIAADEAGI